MSRLVSEPQISSFRHWRTTIGPLRHRYQPRIKPSPHNLTQYSQNVMYTFTILKRATQQVHLVYLLGFTFMY